MKPFTLLVLLAAVASGPAFAQDLRAAMPAAPACPAANLAQPLTLADAVRQAFCANPQTRQWWATVVYQQAQLGQANAAYWPQVSGQAQAYRDWSQSGGQSSQSSQQSGSLSASYLLYDFGGREAAAKLAEAQLRAAIATQNADLNQLAYGVSQAYLDALLAQASLQAARVSEASAKEALDAAEAQLSVGRAIPATMLQAQTAYSQAQLVRIKAEGTVQTSRGVLANLMGLPPETRFELALWHVVGLRQQTEAVGKLMTEAVAQRQDLLAAREAIKASEAAVKSARAQGLPTLSLGASAGRQTGGGFPSVDSQSIGLTLSGPIFTGYRDTFRIRAAQADLEAKRATESSLANQVRVDVWTAYQNFQTNADALQSAHDAVISGDANEQVQLGRFKEGLGTMLDVLSAQASAATARQQLATAEHDYLLSKFALAQALGQLTTRPLPTIGE